MLNYSLVLTCERGLVEIDVSRAARGRERDLAGRARARASAWSGGSTAAPSPSPAARVEPWGLADVSPAMLVGAPNQSLRDLPAALTQP